MSEHGYGPYTNGCRCDVCREAKRAYVADRRASGAEPDRAVAVPAWNDRACAVNGARHNSKQSHKRERSRRSERRDLRNRKPTVTQREESQ